MLEQVEDDKNPDENCQKEICDNQLRFGPVHFVEGSFEGLLRFRR